MKIAFFDAQPHWSGGAKRVFLFARELSLRGHEVHVVCLKGSELARHAMRAARAARAAREARRSGGITVHPYNPAPFLSFFSFGRITLALKKARVEVMDINSPRFYWSGLIAGKFLKSRIILTRNVPFRKNFLKRFVNRALYGNVDLVIAVSEFVKKVFEEDFGRKYRVELLYDSVKQGEFNFRRTSPAGRDAFGLAGRTVLGILGRIEKDKGHGTAIRALSALVKKGRKACLLVAGAGSKSARNKLVSLARSLGVEKDVVFAGFMENVSDAMPLVDIVLAPSLREALGMNIIEALAAAKPVAASRTGGIPEVITDGVNGLLVPPRDAEALAAAVEKLMEPVYGAKLASNAASTAREKFSLENAVPRYEKLCLGLLPPDIPDKSLQDKLETGHMAAKEMKGKFTG